MKRFIYPLAALTFAALALSASGQVSRLLVEDGDAGITNASNLVRNNGATTRGASQCTSNSCTGAAPTAATEGVILSGIGSYIITASLSTGTFSGGGSLQIYVYVDDSGNGGPAAAWYYVMGADIVPTSGKSAVMTLVQPVSLRPGAYRFAVRASAVTTSAAAPVLTTSIRACQTATCAP